MMHSVADSSPDELNCRVVLAIVVAVVAMGIGGWGMWLYEAEHHDQADIFSVAYHTLQLFLLHSPHLDHPSNWQIHVGRWLSAVLVFWAGIEGFGVLFGSELRWRWICWRGKHVIVCGLGRLGRQIAAEFLRGGKRVVMIEADITKKGFAPSGAVVLIGDACEISQLRKAGLSTARQLVAVCDDVQTNVAIATTAGAFLSHAGGAKEGRKLAGWVFVPDAPLRQLLMQDQLFPQLGSRFRVNVRGLDLFELAARQILGECPLDYDQISPASSAVVHLVIVGFGPAGQRLALQAAETGHFANENKLRITVLDRAGNARLKDFLSRYPKFKEVVDLDSHLLNLDAADVAAPILNAVGSGVGQLVTVALCWDSEHDTVTSEAVLFRHLEKDDAINLRLALSMHQSTGEQMPRTIMFQTRKCGFANLFEGGQTATAGIKNVHVFGTIEQTCSLDALMHESIDAVARTLHEDWYKQEAERMKQTGGKPKAAFRTWEQVAEVYRESNRHAADHIPVKLRAIGYVWGRRRKSDHGLTTFDEALHVEPLVKMEHARWCAELVLRGYSSAPGPRNDVDKTHANLVHWDQLDEGTREYDRSQVRSIPLALEKAGLGIYPK